jgi:hypothetical protein
MFTENCRMLNTRIYLVWRNTFFFFFLIAQTIKNIFLYSFYIIINDLIIIIDHIYIYIYIYIIVCTLRLKHAYYLL